MLVARDAAAALLMLRIPQFGCQQRTYAGTSLVAVIMFLLLVRERERLEKEGGQDMGKGAAACTRFLCTCVCVLINDFSGTDLLLRGAVCC